MQTPENIKLLSPNIDHWLKDLKGIKKPAAYKMYSDGNTNKWDYRKRDKLAKNKDHNTLAQLPIRSPRPCVRAIALRDILKIEKDLTRDNFTIEPDTQYLIIRSENAKYRLKMFSPNELTQ